MDKVDVREAVKAWLSVEDGPMLKQAEIALELERVDEEVKRCSRGALSQTVTKRMTLSQSSPGRSHTRRNVPASGTSTCLSVCILGNTIIQNLPLLVLYTFSPARLRENAEQLRAGKKCG